MSSVIQSACDAFGLGKMDTVSTMAKGHIHDTYCVEVAGGTRHIMQCIDPDFFSVPQFSRNVEHVSEQMLGWLWPEWHRDASGELIHSCPFGDYWRAYPYIEGEVNMEVTDPVIAQSVGETFGSFACIPPLNDTRCAIQGFQNVLYHWGLFRKAYALDAHDRRKECEALCALLAHEELPLLRMYAYGENEGLSKRLLHGDPKISNLVFQQDKVVGVIDLDTIMYDYLYIDFSDGVRGISNAYNETSIDGMNMPLLAAYIEAYINACKADSAERLALQKTLPLAATLLSVRFLADYLQGDIYFRTESPDHNLKRAQAQLDLALRLKMIVNEPPISVAFRN